MRQLMETLKVYLAGPFFNEEQIAEADKIKDALLLIKQRGPVAGLHMYDPRHRLVCEEDANDYTAEYIFQRNLEAIRKSDLVIANLMDKDQGTSVEIGYAYAIGKPIVLCWFSTDDRPINLMLKPLAVGLAKNESELAEIIGALQYDPYYIKPVKGKIE